MCCSKSCKVSRLNTIIKSDIRIIVISNLTGWTSLFHTNHVKGTLLDLHWCRIDSDRILTFFCRKPVHIWFYGQDCFPIFFPEFHRNQETDLSGSIFHRRCFQKILCIFDCFSFWVNVYLIIFYFSLISRNLKFIFIRFSVCWLLKYDIFLNAGIQYRILNICSFINFIIKDRIVLNNGMCIISIYRNDPDSGLSIFNRYTILF